MRPRCFVPVRIPAAAIAAGFALAAIAAPAQDDPDPEARRHTIGDWLVETSAENDGGRIVSLTRTGEDYALGYYASYWRGHRGPRLRVAVERQGLSCGGEDRSVAWDGVAAAAVRGRIADALSECAIPPEEAEAVLVGFEAAFALADDWMSEAAAATLAEIAEIEAHGSGTFELTLWANAQGVESLPGLVSIHDHPCGAVAMIRLRVMPPHQEDLDAPGGTELVAELDGHGQAVTRWSVPVDYRPVAIASAELLIDHGEQLLWIDPAGNIRRDATGRVYPPMQAIPCPAGGPLANSDYARCGALTDLASGERREIKYEGPCT